MLVSGDRDGRLYSTWSGWRACSVFFFVFFFFSSWAGCKCFFEVTFKCTALTRQLTAACKGQCWRNTILTERTSTQRLFHPDFSGWTRKTQSFLSLKKKKQIKKTKKTICTNESVEDKSFVLIYAETLCPLSLRRLNMWRSRLSLLLEKHICSLSFSNNHDIYILSWIKLQNSGQLLKLFSHCKKNEKKVHNTI